MNRRARVAAAAVNDKSVNPFAGSSLLPMLVAGLVLTFVGMIAALALS